MLPGVDNALEVIRMDGVAKSPVLQFLDGLAEIFQDLSIEEFEFAHCIQGTNKSRDGVDDHTKAFLALPELRLVTVALDGYSGEVRHLLDDFLIVLSWAARFAPVDRK